MFFCVKGDGFLSTSKCHLLYLQHNLYFLTKKYCYKKSFLLLMSILILFSCSSNDVVEDVHSSNGTIHQGQTSVQLSLKQAKAYASLFSKGFKGTDAEATTRAASLPTPTIKNVEFLIEGKDTLLYAINYSNNRGYVILSGTNNAFPIIGHANQQRKKGREI